ncbi:acetyl-coenzyme A synthetase N-terminal domain-containing protein [Dermatophilus congolensis]|uniref:acetyl-coenzyme A synthetase N-terminal domain-containing protein n=1 Tax=Dermatophilus congolensis TaxID=1863 RepID=UPI000E0FF6D1|nr:acetyl-coenzyme A synthetase N-terminal domain-containing protein [Dermatophilus congolensis]
MPIRRACVVSSDLVETHRPYTTPRSPHGHRSPSGSRGTQHPRRPLLTSKNDFEAFWAQQARTSITWHKDFENVLDWSNSPFVQWFIDCEPHLGSLRSPSLHPLHRTNAVRAF